MFLQRRVIKGVTYRYLDHSFRIGNKVKKVSFIINKNKQAYNERIINKIAADRASYIKENFQTYFSLDDITKIETEKIFYQIFYNLLDRKSKKVIFAEFLRLFLANSMELEGSTITPQLAESIERNTHKSKISGTKRTLSFCAEGRSPSCTASVGKTIILPESEIRLYNNSKKALMKLMNSEFRSVIQFKHFHQEIYDGIYPHAGEFKKFPNTFGYTEKAKTTAPEHVRKELKRILEEFKDKKRLGKYNNKRVYPFLRPLMFHLNYQKVHPFIDGNSRLGRILLVVQMFKLNYPPFIFKGDMGFQIRETLVEYINRNNLDFCRLCLEEYLKTSQRFWRPMIKKFLY